MSEQLLDVFDVFGSVVFHGCFPVAERAKVDLFSRGFCSVLAILGVLSTVIPPLNWSGILYLVRYVFPSIFPSISFQLWFFCCSFC